MLDNATVTRAPDPKNALALFREANDEIRNTPRLGLRLMLRRVRDAFIALWASNLYLSQVYAQTKQENIGLYQFLAATIERYGELRFTKAELGAAAWGKRMRGYCVPGSTDVVFRMSDEALLTRDAPTWLAEAIQGHPVPELALAGEKLLLPVFDITDLDGTKPKAVA